MNDLSDFQRRRGERAQIDLGALDFDQIRRVMRWGLVILALILVWTGLRWAGTFYTDWLWFRELGQESVLVKIVTTRAVLGPRAPQPVRRGPIHRSIPAS